MKKPTPSKARVVKALESALPAKRPAVRKASTALPDALIRRAIKALKQ